MGCNAVCCGFYFVNMDIDSEDEDELNRRNRKPLRRPMDAKDRHPKPRMVGTTHNDYSSPVYWDLRYQRQREKDGPGYTFEWFAELELVQTHLQMVFSEYDAPRVLVVGCGNSKLSELIYNNGHADITNIDFSAVVVKDMKERYKTFEGMLFYLCNVIDLSFFPENSFDIIIDKGCLDCVFSMLDGARSAIKACKEIFRVLAPRGSFLLYSCGSPRTRETHLKAKGLRWDVQGIFVDGTASSYYYIMKTHKKYADSTALAHSRAKRAGLIEGGDEDESKDDTRRVSVISTSSLITAGGGGAPSPQRQAIVQNLRRLSLSKSKR